jgi:ketosteroid isomerase-like protein
MSQADSTIDVVELVDEFHRRQSEMYAGGSTAPVVELLTGDITWHVPGSSLIAGDHRGVQQVIDYFEKRRQLMNSTMRMRPGAVMREGDLVAQFVDGSALVEGKRVSWQTIGVYRVDTGQRRVCEAWLIPLDSELFNRIWSGP